MAKLYKVFCARCQADTAQSGELVKEEIILTCTNPVDVLDESGAPTGEQVACGRSIKVNAELTPEEIKEFLASHKQDNLGQTPINEAAIAKKQEEMAVKVEEALADIAIE